MEVGDGLLGSSIDKDIDLKVVLLLISLVHLVRSESVWLFCPNDLLIRYGCVVFSVVGSCVVVSDLKVAVIVW
jgi:hypothetical protein